MSNYLFASAARTNKIYLVPRRFLYNRCKTPFPACIHQFVHLLILFCFLSLAYKYDICVIGCGPAGFAAAARAWDYGKNVRNKKL